MFPVPEMPPGPQELIIITGCSAQTDLHSSRSVERIKKPELDVREQPVPWQCSNKDPGSVKVPGLQGVGNVKIISERWGTIIGIGFYMILNVLHEPGSGCVNGTKLLEGKRIVIRFILYETPC